MPFSFNQQFSVYFHACKIPNSPLYKKERKNLQQTNDFYIQKYIFEKN